MSSTSNVQNLLANVFRPAYVYDTTNQLYRTKLEMSNIDTITANSVSVFTISAGDSNNNVYVGNNSGNPFSNASTLNTGCNVALGVYAGGTINNSSNSVFVGYFAGNNAVTSVKTVAIGANVKGDGTSNVYIGASTGPVSGVGTKNIFIGAGIAPAVAPSNTLQIGNAVYANMSNQYFGIWNPTPTHALDVCGSVQISTPGLGGSLGINIDAGPYNLNVNGNMYVSDGYGGLTLSSSGVTSNSTLSFVNMITGKSATIKSSGGFYSVQGTITQLAFGAASNTGAVLQKGIMMVSAQDTSSSSTNYHAGTWYVRDATGSSAPILMTTATQAGVCTISFSSSNIRLSNSAVSGSSNFAWTVTYFPSP